MGSSTFSLSLSESAIKKSTARIGSAFCLSVYCALVLQTHTNGHHMGRVLMDRSSRKSSSSMWCWQEEGQQLVISICLICHPIAMDHTESKQDQVSITQTASDSANKKEDDDVVVSDATITQPHCHTTLAANWCPLIQLQTSLQLRQTENTTSASASKSQFTDGRWLLVLFYQLCLLIFGLVCVVIMYCCSVLSAKSASELCILFAFSSVSSPQSSPQIPLRCTWLWC